MYIYMYKYMYTHTHTHTHTHTQREREAAREKLPEVSPISMRGDASSSCLRPEARGLALDREPDTTHQHHVRPHLFPLPRALPPHTPCRKCRPPSEPPQHVSSCASSWGTAASSFPSSSPEV